MLHRFFFAAVIGLLLSCISSAVHVSPFDPPPGWNQVQNNLGFPFFHSSVVYHNNSIFLVGGCASPFCADSAVASRITAHRVVYGVNIVSGEFYPVMKYPPLPAELKYVRIAGTHAALSAGTASIFVFAPCTLTFQEKGYYDTLSGKEKQAMLAEFSSIWRLSPDPKIATAYDEAELFFVIPTERARVNASCTYIGNVVYIMGGYLLNDTRSGNGKVWATDEVDSFDLNSKVYKSRVEYLRDAVLHPSVTSSSTAFVVGGGLTKPSVTGEVAISQKVSIFFPEGDRTPDESRPMCASALEDHLSETAVARLFPKTVSSEEKELLILGLDSCRMKMFGAVLLLANHNSSTMVSVDLRGRQASYFLSNGGTSSGDDSTSYVVSYAPIAAMFPHIVFEPVAPNSTDVESRTFLAVYQLSGVDIFFDCDTAAAGECVKQYYFSTRGLFRYFSSVETNSIVLPTPKLDREDYRKHNQTYGSLISFSMNSLSYGEYCLNSRKEKRCLIRLSSRKDCMGNAAGTADGLYAGASNEAINFTATGDSNPVYFCVGLPTTGELPNYNRKTIFDDDAYCRPSTMFTIADELLYSIRVEAGDVTTTTTTTVAPTPPSPGGSGSGTILIVICVILLFLVLLLAWKRISGASGLPGLFHANADSALRRFLRLKGSPEVQVRQRNMAVFCDEENRLRAGKSISDLCTAGSLTVCLRYLKLASSRQLVFQQQNKYCIEKIVGEGSDSLVFRVKRYTDDLSEVLPQHLALKFVGAPNEAARSKWIKTVDQLKALRNYQPNLNIPLDLFINFNPVHFISSNPTDGNATSVVVGSASPPSASVVHQVPEGFWLKLEAKELLRHFTMNHDGELKENSLPRWYFCQVSEYYETNALTYLGNLAAFRNASVSKNEDFPLESVLCSVLYQTSSQLLLLSRETPALWHGNLKVSNLMVKNSTAKRHLGNTFFLPITLTDSGMSRWADYTLLERLTRYDESDDVLDPLARSSPGRDARDCFTGTKCGRLFIVERKPKHLCELLRTILQTPHFIAPERILVSFLKIPSLADLFLAPVETLLRSGAISVQLPLSRRLLRKHTQQQSNGGRQVSSGHWFTSKYLCSHKNDGSGNIDSRGAPTDAGEHANGASDLPLPPRKYYAGPPLFQGTRSNTVKEWRKQYAQQFAESQLRGENMHHLHNEQVTALEEEVAGEMQLPQENSGSFINLGATFNNYSEFFSVPSPSLSVSDHDRFPVDRSTYETSTPSETTCHTVTSVSAESSEMFLLMLSLLDKNRSSDDLWSLGVTLFELSVAAVPKTRAESANTSRTISASSLSVDALEALTTDLGTYRPEELTEGVKWQNSIAFEQSVLAYLTTLGCYSNQWTWMVSRLLSPVPSRRPGLEQILSTLRYQSSTEACDADPVLLDYTGDELHETCVLYLHHQND